MKAGGGWGVGKQLPTNHIELHSNFPTKQCYSIARLNFCALVVFHPRVAWCHDSSYPVGAIFHNNDGNEDWISLCRWREVSFPIQISVVHVLVRLLLFSQFDWRNRNLQLNKFGASRLHVFRVVVSRSFVHNEDWYYGNTERLSVESHTQKWHDITTLPFTRVFCTEGSWSWI